MLTNLWCIFCILFLAFLWWYLLGDYTTSNVPNASANLPGRTYSTVGDSGGLRASDGIKQRDYK